MNMSWNIDLMNIYLKRFYKFFFVVFVIYCCLTKLKSPHIPKIKRKMTFKFKFKLSNSKIIPFHLIFILNE